MDLEKLKARLKGTSNTSSTKDKEETLKYFKTEVGKSYDIRILDLSKSTSTGEPIFSLMVYKKLSEKIGDKGKLISPKTFGEEDVISDVFEEMRKKRSKEDWNIAKNLKAEETCYAVIIDRAQESEGPLFWELKPELRNKIYSIVMNDEYSDEQLFDEDKGFDWTLTVTQKLEGGKPKTWNGYPVKEFDILPKRKPSKLNRNADKAAEWLSKVPDMNAHFRKFTLSEDKLKEKLDLYLERMAAEAAGNISVTEVSKTEKDGLMKAPNVSEEEKLKKLESAFEDEDDSMSPF